MAIICYVKKGNYLELCHLAHSLKSGVAKEAKIVFFF